MNFKNALLPLAVGLLLTACNGEDPAPRPITLEVSDASFSIDENPENGDIVGTVSASASSGDLLFEITEQSVPDAIEINATTGQLTVANAAAFDFETNPTMTITVGMTAEDGETAQASISVQVVNLPEVLNYNALSGVEIDENSLNGTNTGVYVFGTTDAGSVVYTIDESLSDMFEMDTEGRVLVKDSRLLDFEELDNPMITIGVTLTNSLDASITTNVELTLTVLDIEGADEVEERLNNDQTPKQIYDADNTLLEDLYGKEYAGGQIAIFNTATGTGMVIAPVQAYDQTWNQANDLCNNLELNGYDDWRLNTTAEAQQLCERAGLFYSFTMQNGFEIPDSYWSADNCGGICYQNWSFSQDRESCINVGGGSPNFATYDVRPVRSF